MRIRAAVLEHFGEPLVVQDVELGGPQAGEVSVRLHAYGVCHIAIREQQNTVIEYG